MIVGERIFLLDLVNTFHGTVYRKPKIRHQRLAVVLQIHAASVLLIGRAVNLLYRFH
jgi:hypothetical protein